MPSLFKRIKDKFTKKIEDPGPDIDLVEELLSEGESQVPPELDKMIVETIMPLIDRKPRKAIPLITHQISNYPNEPELWKFLFIANHSFGDEEGKQEALSKGLAKFPDFLFLKVQFGFRLLNEDKAEEVPAVFKNTFNLRKLYKNLDGMSVVDVLLFWKLICYYYLDTKQVDLADNYYSALLEMDYTDEILDAFFDEMEEEGLDDLEEEDLDSDELDSLDDSDIGKDSFLISEETRPVVYEGTEKLLEKMLKMARENPKKALPLLKDLVLQYPLEPIFYNYLHVAYTLLRDEQECTRITLEIRKKFPDYFFGKVTYAHYLLQNDRLNEFMKVFNNENILSRAFPGRKEFHLSEAMAFFEVMGRYYMRIEEFEFAIQFYKQLLKLKPNVQEFEDKVKTLKMLIRAKNEMEGVKEKVVPDVVGKLIKL